MTQPPNPFSNKKIGSTFYFILFYFIVYNNYYFHFSGGWGGVCSLLIINFLCYGPSHRPMTTSKGGRRTREREKKRKKKEKNKIFPTYIMPFYCNFWDFPSKQEATYFRTTTEKKLKIYRIIDRYHPIVVDGWMSSAFCLSTDDRSS